MSSRIDNLPENQVITQLLEARKNLDELKNRQYTSGRSGVLGYLSQTSNTWDWEGTVTTGEEGWDIVFTGDGSQRYPIVEVFADVFHTVPNVEINRISSAYNTYTSGANTIVTNNFFVKSTSVITSLYDHKWTLILDVTGSLPLYIKVHVIGSSPGTITVTKVL